MSVDLDAQPVELPWRAEPKFRCFGCSPDNPVGLALQLYRLADGRIAGRSTLGEDYASYPGIVHGGIINVLVDEVMGDLIAIERGMLAFCLTLRTKMLRPLRTGRPYLTAARLTGENAGSLRTEADVLGDDGEVHVMASATYQPIRSEQAQSLMGLDDAEYDRLRHYFDHSIGLS